MRETNHDKAVKKGYAEKNFDFEEKQNAVEFFDLLLQIAIREKIDIGQYDDNRNTNNTNKTE